MFLVIEQHDDGSVKVLSNFIQNQKEAEVEAAWLSHLHGWSCTVQEIQTGPIVCNNLFAA